jgi:putative N6-adenine-specific DNA methylase
MIPLKAPMQETLAAGVVLATGWEGKGNFINPMCGSGTLAIEAALIALERAPGLLRSNYGFMHLKEFDGFSWKALRRKTRAEAKERLNRRIIEEECDDSRRGAFDRIRSLSFFGDTCPGWRRGGYP